MPNLEAVVTDSVDGRARQEVLRTLHSGIRFTRQSQEGVSDGYWPAR